MTLSHADLVTLAHSWLLGAGECGFAFTEPQMPRSSEMPDALGYRGNGFTILIECKTSRADFLADRKKPFRRMPSMGVGGLRYFMTPPGLVKPEELPAKWGLIYAYPSGQTRSVVNPPRPKTRAQLDALNAAVFVEHERNTAAEFCLLMSALRRVEIKGFWHVIESAFDVAPATDPQPLRVPLWDLPDELVLEGVS